MSTQIRGKYSERTNRFAQIKDQSTHHKKFNLNFRQKNYTCHQPRVVKTKKKHFSQNLSTICLIAVV